MRRNLIPRREPGQALILVALTLGILVTFAVVGKEVAYQRRSLARVQNSVDMAVLAGLRVIEPVSLAQNDPRLDTLAASDIVRITLRQQLRRVSGALSDNSDAVAGSVQVSILGPGGNCQGRPPATGPAICAELSFGIRSLLGERRYTYETFAQSTDNLQP